MCLFAQQLDGPTIVFLLVLVVTIGFLLRRSHRYFSRQSHSPTVRIEPAKPLLRGAGVHGPDDAARWEVEMHETARDLSGLLDSKMGALEHLIRESDRAAARLEKALAGVDGRCAPEEQESPTPLPPGSQAEGLTPSGSVQRAVGDNRGPTEGEAGASERDRRYQEIHQEIHTLADYGFEPGEIARRVGTPIGEVQLILDLRPKR